MSTLNWVDYGILVIVGLSVITGLFRGFIKELIALLVWILAIWVSLNYTSALSPKLAPYITDAQICNAASFVLLLLGTIVLGSIVSTLLSFILNRTPLKGTDRLLGMGFGLLRGVFIVALLIGMINLTSLSQERDFRRASFIQHIQPLSNWLFSFTPNLVAKISKPSTQTDMQLNQTKDALHDSKNSDTILDTQ